MTSKSKEEYIDIQLDQYLERANAHEISLSDIVTSTEYKALCPTEESCNLEDLKGLLYKFGMDTSLPIEEQNLTHRNWVGVVVTCPRWVGTIRKDQEWLDYLSNVNV